MSKRTDGNECPLILRLDETIAIVVLLKGPALRRLNHSVSSGRMNLSIAAAAMSARQQVRFRFRWRLSWHRRSPCWAPRRVHPSHRPWTQESSIPFKTSASSQGTSSCRSLDSPAWLRVRCRIRPALFPCTFIPLAASTRQGTSPAIRMSADRAACPSGCWRTQPSPHSTYPATAPGKLTPREPARHSRTLTPPVLRWQRIDQARPLPRSYRTYQSAPQRTNGVSAWLI